MADDGVHVIGVRRQQGVHKGQLFLFRAVQVHLDTKFPVDSAGIPVADGGDYGLIRHHQEKLRRLAGDQDGAVVSGKVHDGPSDVKREVFDIEGIRQVQILCLDQHLFRLQVHGMAGEAAVVIGGEQPDFGADALLRHKGEGVSCVIADGVPRSGPPEQLHLPACVRGGGLDPLQSVLVQGRLLFRRHFVQGLDHVHIIGIHPLQSSLQPGVQADGGGYRHQHHGGEDADVGQAHGVLLHPVQQPRHGGEVLGLVVVPGAVPQALQQGDGPGGEQAVGADHHQRHRQEEIGQGGKGVLYRQSGGIASPQSDGPQHHQQAAGPGLPLPGTGAVEQFHRTGPEQPEQVPHQRQQEEEAEESGGIGHAGKADLKAILHRQVGQLQ